MTGVLKKRRQMAVACGETDTGRRPQNMDTQTRTYKLRPRMAGHHQRLGRTRINTSYLEGMQLDC